MSRFGFDEHERNHQIAWLLLGLPLALYVIFWPIRARLDRGVIERHLGGSIWGTMADSLPEIGPQVVLQIGFWVGCAGFMTGALYLVWLALAGEGTVENLPIQQDVAEPAETQPQV